jgi:hypothetical protein
VIKFYSCNTTDDVVNKIVNVLPQYQECIKSWKREGYTIVGYARKSKGKVDDETRIKLLNLMCQRLKARSSIDKIFVSPCANAGDPLMQRDMQSNQNILHKLEVDGDMQGLKKRS